MQFTLTKAQSIITTVAGNGTQGYSGDGGYATSAQLSYAEGMIFDGGGNMYIADSYNNVIRKINTIGIITTIAGTGFGAGTGAGGYSGDGGAATLAQLNGPVDIVFDASGNLYISDYNNNRVRKINTSGVITTIAGNGNNGYSGDGAAATLAKLYEPSGLAFDATGNLYIADEQNNVIRKINTAGIISTYAGNGFGAGMGTGGYSGDGGQATVAELFEPIGLTFDLSGNLYVAESGNNVVRKINTSGIINTYAGGGISGLGDGGPATLAQLNFPYGLTFDKIGNLYIGDALNNRVRKVSTSGIINTIVGDGIAGYSGDGGLAITAELYDPYNLLFDSIGNLYIADDVNSSIRKVSNVATTDINQVSGIRHQVSVYPNPATSSITISSNQLAVNTNIQITDVLGNDVAIQTTIQQGETVIDISTLQNGIYFVIITNNEQSITEKLIINK
ncbi:MAG: T9SS type A sorting domain-containing protein [Bacteroidia bacterium]